jgi:hypothetical protein
VLFNPLRWRAPSTLAPAKSGSPSARLSPGIQPGLFFCAGNLKGAATPTIRESCDLGHINLDPRAYRGHYREMEVAMSKITLQVPANLTEAIKQVFVGGPRIASPDLQNFSDKALEDIGLARRRANFEIVKPLWLP